ncbi:MAG TPA: MBL fold metallo-hydrolase [Bryobacteraceae bacterium]|jgi:glyoxylase-like metal-dependent hydrolase (beta-lactamase superfamily II)
MSPLRRDFLRAVAAGAASLSLSRSGFAQANAQASPAATKLTDKITLITGAGNNVVALAGDGGSLLVDCGDAAHARDVLKLAGNVKTAFNTHWHTESTGGNDAMAEAGAKLVSHVHTELWMTQEIIHDWEKKVWEPRAKGALPKETFYTNGKTTFGGEPIEYGLMPVAHTDGDIYVHFLQSNVLAVGDVVQAGRLPVLDFPTGGWIGGMQTAHRTILGLANDETKIVPATGPVMTKAEVQANLDILTKVRDQLVKLMKQGKGAQNMIDAKALKDFEGQLAGDPDEFIFTAYRGLWAHVRELGGIV